MFGYYEYGDNFQIQYIIRHFLKTPLTISFSGRILLYIESYSNYTNSCHYSQVIRFTDSPKAKRAIWSYNLHVWH